MAWLGKLLGGTFGLFFGGPLGMVAGIAFGHLFDAAEERGKYDEDDAEDQEKRRRAYDEWSRRQQQWQREQQGYYRQEQRQASRPDASFKTFEEQHVESEGKLKITQKQLLYYTGTFSMIYCVAAVDGSVTKNEIVAIERDIITERLQFTLQEGKVAMKFFHAAEESKETIDAYAKQFYQVFSSSPALLQLMVDFLYQVRAVDGDASGRKEMMIRQVARIFQIPDSVVSAIKRKYGSSVSTDRLFATLYLPSTATAEETKKAWRKLCAEFHPDTLASQGLGSEFKKVAESQFANINNAYDAIKSLKGWS